MHELACLLPSKLLIIPFKLNFLKPAYFHFGYDYYASARMVASHLNHQIVVLLIEKRPMIHC